MYEWQLFHGQSKSLSSNLITWKTYLKSRKTHTKHDLGREGGSLSVKKNKNFDFRELQIQKRQNRNLLHDAKH